MRNILVTGSSGFIGKHLVAYLDSLNFNVHVLLRKHSSTDSKISASINRLYFDRDKTSLKETKEIDCILHLATCYGRADETREEIFDANLKYGLRVLELAKDIKAKYFINFDTSLPSNLNDYSLSKAAFRSAIENLDHSNLNIINLRIETIYGPNKKGTDFSNLIIESCLEGANLIELSNCEQVRDFIFYKDLISCVETILNNLLFLFSILLIVTKNIELSKLKIILIFFAKEDTFLK